MLTARKYYLSILRSNKKGDMNWTIITLVLALVAMLIFVLIINNAVDKYAQSTGKITDKATQELDEASGNLFGEPIIMIREAFEQTPEEAE